MIDVKLMPPSSAKPSRRPVVGAYRGMATWIYLSGSQWRLDFDPPLDLPPWSEVDALLQFPPPEGPASFAVELVFRDCRPWWRRMLAMHPSVKALNR